MKNRTNSMSTVVLRLLAGLPLVTIALCCATTGQAQPRAGFAPQWKRGNTWVIQTRYQVYQVRADPVPTVTLRWRFEVTRETPRAFTIVARCMNQNAWTQFQVDKANMSVAYAEFHSTALGREQVLQAKYSGKGMTPRVAEVGTAPIHMPLFPLGVDAESRYHRDVAAGEQTHEVVITQRVEQADAEGIRKFLAERLGASAVVPESRRYYIVTSVEGSASVEQVWAEGLPWFLYSRTPASTSSWLGQ